jgi:hypothetical protein
MKIMRKYMIGALFGFILAFTVSAHAEVTNMIGKVIDGAFPVKVNGTTLQNQALVIEGTSYLPVREFAESLGMDVKFDANMGIELTRKTVTPIPIPNPNKINVQHFQTAHIEGVDKENGQFDLIELDGNQYVSPVVLSGNPFSITWKNPNLIFSKDEQDIVINAANDYSPNIDGFSYQGIAYVKLSVLGLKANVNGNTLAIEKQ